MPELLERLRSRRPTLRAGLLCLAGILFIAILATLLHRGGQAPTQSKSVVKNMSEKPLLVSREQMDRLRYTDSVLGELRWDLSDGALKELNQALSDYGIATPEDISQFLAQAAVESLAGSALTEWGDAEYFQGRGYSAGTRGAGYLHLTYAYGQMAFSVWLMRKYVPELSDLAYVNPSRHSREEIADSYYTALQTAANRGLDVSRYSRVVYDRRDPAETGYTTGADYIAEVFAWESAAYFWHIAGVSEAFLNIPCSLNTDIASDIVGGSNWQSRREAYAAYYPVLAEQP